MEIAKDRQIHIIVICFLAVLSLYFSFTNFFYASAISCVCVVFLPFIIKTRSKRFDGLVVSLFAFFLYCAVSTIITNPRQLIDFGFYRYDGNLFITFMPLLVLPLVRIRFNIKKILVWFVSIASLANVLGLIRFFLHRQPEYPFFFTAHNAAGGFLAMLLIVNVYVIRSVRQKKILFFVFFAINLLGFYLTNSRGSWLPLIGACFVFLLMKRWKYADIVITGALVLGVFSIAGYIAMIRGSDVIVHYDEYTLPPIFEGSELSSLLLGFGRSWTMVNRLYYLWPKATYLFAESPLFGAGFGTFNDNSYHWVGVEHFLYFNVGNVYVNGANHAHNSYLHILAETGLVGFGLFVFFLLEIRQAIGKLSDPKLRSLLNVAFLYALYSGLFEHRITTPAQMIPFVLILGMALSSNKNQKSAILALASLFAANVVIIRRKVVVYEN